MPTSSSPSRRCCASSGRPDPSDPRAEALTQSAFARVSARLLGEVARRHPGADLLDAELLVSSLMGGVVVIATHWIDRTDGRTDAAGRAVWDDLLTHLLDTVRNGYLPVPA